MKGLFGNSFDVSVGVEPMLVLHLRSLGILAQSCPFLEQNLFKCLEMFLAFVGMFLAAYVARHCNTHAKSAWCSETVDNVVILSLFGFPHKTVSGLSKFTSGGNLQILNMGTWLPSLTVINHHGDALAACQMQQDTHERTSCNQGTQRCYKHLHTISNLICFALIRTTLCLCVISQSRYCRVSHLNTAHCNIA